MKDLKNNETISVLVPTRQRPSRVKEFLTSIVNTAYDFSKVEILFYIDQDDKDTNESELLSVFSQLNIKALRRPKINIQGDRYNYLLSQSSGEIIMYAADDIVFESMHWDKRVYSRFTRYQDRIVLLYPSTPNHKCKLATHGFVSRTSTQILGKIFTSYFQSAYDDVWLTKLYSFIKRAECFSKISVCHKHPSLDKRIIDDIYINNKKKSEKDAKVFDAKKHEISQDAVKLQNYILKFRNNK